MSDIDVLTFFACIEPENSQQLDIWAAALVKFANDDVIGSLHDLLGIIRVQEFLEQDLANKYFKILTKH